MANGCFLCKMWWLQLEGGSVKTLKDINYGLKCLAYDIRWDGMGFLGAHYKMMWVT